MATQVWLGAAVPIVDTWTLTVGGTWSASDTLTVKIGEKSLVLTVDPARLTVANVTDDVADMINGNAANGSEARSALGSNVPEFRDVTATSDGTSTITITGADNGRPLDLTVSETGASGTFTASNTYAGTGPNTLDNADNWSSGSNPSDGDDIIFDHRAAGSCLYALEDLNTITPASITITSGFAYNIGLPDVNADNTSYLFDENLPTRLQLCDAGDSTNTKIQIDAAQSSRIRLDTQDGQITMLVNSTGPRPSLYESPVDWIGTHASNAVTIKKGIVAIAPNDDDSATVATLTINYDTIVESDAIVVCGDGATLTTINKSGGQLTTNSNVTTLTQTGGTTRFTSGRGTAATLTTANVKGGTLFYESEGTLTNLTVANDGVVDMRNDSSSRTFTNVDFYAGISWHDPEGSVTVTNGFDLNECGMQDIRFNGPRNKTWTPSAI